MWMFMNVPLPSENPVLTVRGLDLLGQCLSLLLSRGLLLKRGSKSSSQVLEELSVIAESNNFKTKGPLDLPDFAPPAAPSLALPASRSLPSTPDEAGRGVVGGGMSAPNINSIKGAAGSIFSRLKAGVQSGFFKFFKIIFRFLWLIIFISLLLFGKIFFNSVIKIIYARFILPV